MLFIRHRINTVEELGTVPPHMGIEVDIRAEGTEIILQHDPFLQGERFEDFLRHYRHELIVLNIKDEGTEEPALELLQKYGVRNYFFLDLDFPAMMRLIKKGEKNIALRFSEYEPLDPCLAFKGMAGWVWVDCFNDLPLDRESHAALKKNFKLCLVSPELQKFPKERIADFKKKLTGLALDAVCTKHPDLWI